MSSDKNSSLELRLRIQEIRDSIQEREKEREEILKKGKIPWYGQLICGIVFLATVFFLVIPGAMAIGQENWAGFIICLVLFVIINGVWILIAINSKKSKRYKKLGQEIEKLKREIKNLENSIR